MTAPTLAPPTAPAPFRDRHQVPVVLLTLGRAYRDALAALAAAEGCAANAAVDRLGRRANSLARILNVRIHRWLDAIGARDVKRIARHAHAVPADVRHTLARARADSHHNYAYLYMQLLLTAPDLVAVAGHADFSFVGA